MKIQIRLIIGIVIGLVVGFGAGLYTGQIRNAGVQMQVAALKQPTELPELQAARAHLKRLRADFTDQNARVKRVKDRILALEEEQLPK